MILQNLLFCSPSSDSAPEEEPESADSANSDFLLRCSLLRQGPNLKILDSAESAISA